MADTISITLGAQPWLPTQDTEAGEVLNYYDVPLAGLISQHNVVFAYECVYGHVGDTSVWAYWHLSEEDEAALGAADDPPGVESVLRSSRSERLIVVGLARGDELMMASVLSPGPYEADEELSAAALRALLLGDDAEALLTARTD